MKIGPIDAVFRVGIGGLVRRSLPAVGGADWPQIPAYELRGREGTRKTNAVISKFLVVITCHYLSLVFVCEDRMTSSFLR